MATITRFVRLDLRSVQPNAKYLAIPVLAVIAPGLLLLSPYLMIPAVTALAAANAPSYLFGNDDRGRLDTLYTALGLRRGQVVAGRYATCLLLLLALAVTGVLLAAVAALAFGTAFRWPTVAALAAGSIAFTGISLAAQLPAYFGTTPGPIRVVVALPPTFVLLALYFAWISPTVRDHLLSWLATTNLAWLIVAALAVLTILTTASAALATHLYARRDL